MNWFVGAIASHTYTFINSALMEDLEHIIGSVGSWFTTNALLMMMLTVTLVGLGIKIIKSIKSAIA